MSDPKIGTDVVYKYGHDQMSKEELRALAVEKGAPTTFEQLVAEWSDRIDMLAGRYGFRGEDINDFRATIFLQFFEGGYMQVYNPRVAVFSTFMYNFIQKRLLQHVSRKKRDPISGYVPLVSSGDDDPKPGELFLDLLDDPDQVVTESVVESTQTIQEIRRCLRELPQRGKRNLAALFDMIILDRSRADMADALDVSEATVCLMIKDLRGTEAVKLLRWQ